MRIPVLQVVYFSILRVFIGSSDISFLLIGCCSYPGQINFTTPIPKEIYTQIAILFSNWLMTALTELHLISILAVLVDILVKKISCAIKLHNMLKQIKNLRPFKNVITTERIGYNQSLGLIVFSIRDNFHFSITDEETRKQKHLARSAQKQISLQILQKLLLLVNSPTR